MSLRRVGLALCVTTTRCVSTRARRMPRLSDRRAVSEADCRVCLQEGSGAAFDLGLNTFRVPMALHALNRAKLAESLSTSHSRCVALLQGGDQTTRYDTDHEPVFRQESYFQWLFGVAEPGCFGAVRLKDGAATLFVPDLRVEAYEIFCGQAPTLEEFRAKYAVDEVLYVEDMPKWLAEQLDAAEDDVDSEGPSELLVLHGLNTDSGKYSAPARFAGMERFSVNDSPALFEALAELRTRKSQAEVEVMRYVNWVSSMAHAEVMRAARPGMMEYQLESLFMHHTYTHGGCRHMAYTCICACGPNPAILHYGHAGKPNARLLKEGDSALLDMGAEYHCYASDITCSFPISSRSSSSDSDASKSAFSKDQRVVYEAVLEAQRRVIQKLKPGVAWPEMHLLAERAVLEALIETGALTGCVDDMVRDAVGAVFFPHGLGHLIGLDTHDVGGYLVDTPARPERAGLAKLRTARTLEQGMVVTVEPGCYFIDLLLDRAANDPQIAQYLVLDRLADFRGTGGVRLEDDVLITEHGCENLSQAPRTVDEVDAVLRGGQWPPMEDQAPELKRAWCAPNHQVQGAIMLPLNHLRQGPPEPD